jgi:hypothetical protein
MKPKEKKTHRKPKSEVCTQICKIARRKVLCYLQMYSSNFVFEHVVRGNFSKFFRLNKQKKKPIQTEENLQAA